MLLSSNYLGKTNYWRIIEPFLLGFAANILINYVFDPNNPDFRWEEFLIAWLFAVPITELNRKVDLHLERKISWTTNFFRRFMVHLAYLMLTLLFIINVVGNIYTWLIGDSFYNWKELLLINSITFIVALLLTLLKWTSHFYKNWQKTESHLKNSNQKFEELKSNLNKEVDVIQLRKGNRLYNIRIKQIQFAKSKFGIIWVYTENATKGVFNGSLTELEALLPKHLFFRASRNAIVRRDTIVSLVPSTYGKILLQINESVPEKGSIVVSRPKAARFRKWYNSNSV